ncbi:MAG: hypothetical protein ACR2LQ_00810 [Acidimicrobiales bacterium]
MRHRRSRLRRLLALGGMLGGLVAYRNRRIAKGEQRLSSHD